MAANLQAYKGRITALEKTASITKALSQISSSKISLLGKDLDNFIKFNNEFDQTFKEVLKHRVGNPMVLMTQGTKRLFILISSDRGLVGSYHNHLFKAFLERLENFDKDDYLVFIIGKKGYNFAKRNDLPLLNKNVIINYDEISTYTFKEETESVLETYLTGIFTGVEIHYMSYINAMKQEPKSKQILPVEVEFTKDFIPSYHYDQNIDVLIRQMAVIYIEAEIFGALLKGKMSEHASRLVAMKNATDNAKEIAVKLNTIYHRLRQQQITDELIDIINASHSGDNQ